MKRGRPAFWMRPPAFDSKPRRYNSAPVPGTPAGSSHCGRDCSARWATNTTSGPCKTWPNCVRAGGAERSRSWRCRRGCSASAACCRGNCREPRRGATVICVASGIAGGVNAMSSAIPFCRGRSGGFTDCARPIIPNAGWHWPRTGWRRTGWSKTRGLVRGRVARPGIARFPAGSFRGGTR